jgi:hypothetical protein
VAIKVTVNLSLLNQMRRAVSSAKTKRAVGEQIIEDMKDSISKGISPVKGERRFVAYKDPKSYPGDLKDKRPVNLYLSGDMLAALKFYPHAGAAIGIGIKGPMGKIAKYNNDGTKHVPRRHFMPTEKGEEFSVTITRRIRDLYSSIISDILKR